MFVSTSLNVFESDYPVEQALHRCRAAGFEHLDLNYWDHQPRLVAETWAAEERWAQRIRAAAAAEGIVFTQMHGPVHGECFETMVLSLTPDSYLELLQRALRTAAIIGVPWMVLHPTAIARGGTETWTETLNYNATFFARLIPTLESTGVGIAIENMFDRAKPSTGGHRRRFCSNVDELIQVVDTIGHPLVGACWDTGHGHVQNLDQYAAITALGSRLRAVHIQDNDGLNDQHLLPYSGSIDWAAVVSALRTIGFGGDFTYETHNAVRKLPDHLRDDALRYAAAIGTKLIRG